MALSSTTSRVNYTGNGAVDTYAYTFRIIDDDDLLVTVMNTDETETTLTKTTDYTVTGVGASSGGNVVLVNSAQAWLDGDGDLKSSYILTIRRVRTLDQTTDIRNQGSFYPETHEDAFDHFIMIDQQQQDAINRSVRLPESLISSDFNPVLPADIEGVADSMPVTNSTGSGWADAEDWVSVSTVAGSLSITGTRAAPSAIVAGTGVAFTGAYMRQRWFVQGSGGAVTVSATPSIAAGTAIGQHLTIQGRSDTNTVTLQSDTSIGGAIASNLIMNGDAELGADDVIEFDWDGTYWIESGRNH